MNFSFFVHQKKKKRKWWAQAEGQDYTSAKDTFEHKEVGDFPQEWVPKPGTFLSLWNIINFFFDCGGCVWIFFLIISFQISLSYFILNIINLKVHLVVCYKRTPYILLYIYIYI